MDRSEANKLTNEIQASYEAKVESDTQSLLPLVFSRIKDTANKRRFCVDFSTLDELLKLEKAASTDNKIKAYIDDDYIDEVKKSLKHQLTSVYHYTVTEYASGTFAIYWNDIK